jgi:hypothetical protein
MLTNGLARRGVASALFAARYFFADAATTEMSGRG